MVPKASDFVRPKDADQMHVAAMRDAAQAVDDALREHIASVGKADAMREAIELARPHTERPGSR